MEYTYEEFRVLLEEFGYNVDGMCFEEIDEFAEIEGYEWDYTSKFVAIEGLDETEL